MGTKDDSREAQRGFATPLLMFCAKSCHPQWHKVLWTGLKIPSGGGLVGCAVRTLPGLFGDQDVASL